jgi:hypothetical protein
MTVKLGLTSDNQPSGTGVIPSAVVEVDNMRICNEEMCSAIAEALVSYTRQGNTGGLDRVVDIPTPLSELTL